MFATCPQPFFGQGRLSRCAAPPVEAGAGLTTALGGPVAQITFRKIGPRGSDLLMVPEAGRPQPARSKMRSVSSKRPEAKGFPPLPRPRRGCVPNPRFSKSSAKRRSDTCGPPFFGMRLE
eukprot:11752994-Alexandrium_andersonii.AAC.1